MFPRVLATCAALLVVSVTAGCGDDEGGSTEVETIEITVEGGQVTPDGDRISVDVGQPVDLVVTADAEGVIGVHADPEQTYPFTAGENAPIKLQFDRPGVVDVETHDPDLLIAQLEVQ